MGQGNDLRLLDDAVAVLQQRIAAMGGLASYDLEWVNSLSTEGTVLSAALTQAALETIWTSTLSGFDEEHHTSSFMGHFASCLSWFNLMDRWQNPEDHDALQPEIYWAQQPKHIEAIRGGDFGLARRIGENFVNIKLFQAKKAPFMPLPFSHYRRVADRNFADAELRKYAFGQAPGKIDSVTRLHQIHRLLRWQEVGNAVWRDIHGQDKVDPIWCYYMYWSQPLVVGKRLTYRLPTAAAAAAVYGEVSQEMNSRKPKANLSLSAGRERKSFLAMVMADESGICLNKEDARVLLGAMARVNLPDFVAIDGSGDDSGSFWQDIFDQEAVITRRSSRKSKPPRPARDHKPIAGLTPSK
ncbi:hypothetical protein HGP14_32065 [Rhizobium sp. P32RR-XVIII]|uniref:hypothetical protein n=1 Tax=Rhizobium sp. P32RR-XVIII TaxID=2726738 RepID=UPI0014578BFF|nr:hypothetical protein [Rhizobium sp. P32RR-XVIII]NLS07870.1 hypothetical protein [Rhizobium sp. P32RR-XVIII]